ncbi:unnamed protein product [Microthlaspi erraticum]|uniref:Uncharacterized protein n=1 Tax=Microthlaspi erraticum TaxID=1685480 RepID=A0A6D2J6K9_9BRAS|nr:unnamed protein product [Microthlaspi erraticum]
MRGGNKIAHRQDLQMAGEFPRVVDQSRFLTSPDRRNSHSLPPASITLLLDQKDSISEAFLPGTVAPNLAPILREGLGCVNERNWWNLVSDESKSRVQRRVEIIGKAASIEKGEMLINQIIAETEAGGVPSLLGSMNRWRLKFKMIRLV